MTDRVLRAVRAVVLIFCVGACVCMVALQVNILVSKNVWPTLLPGLLAVFFGAVGVGVYMMKPGRAGR